MLSSSLDRLRYAEEGRQETIEDGTLSEENRIVRQLEPMGDFAAIENPERGTIAIEANPSLNIDLWSLLVTGDTCGPLSFNLGDFSCA